MLNNIIKFICFSFLLMSFCSCEDYMYINKTLNKVCKLAKKYNMQVFGSGVAAPGIIKNFRLTFDKYGHYTEDEARKLIIDFTEDFIETIKSTPEVLNYMEKLPINENHAYFLIVFYDSKSHYQKDLSAITLANGFIKFNTSDERGFNEYRRESYSEAYFKVYGKFPPERH